MPQSYLLAAALTAVSLLNPVCTMAEPGHVFPPLTPQEMARIAAAVPKKASATPKQPRRILVFYRTEGYVHASIPYGNEALKEIGKQTGAYTAEFSDSMDAFTPENLKRFDAVVFNNTTQLKFPDPVHRKALLDFLKSGHGLVGLHAGSDNFPTWPEMQAILGGVFHSHPWKADDVEAVKIDDPDNPVAESFGSHGFWIREEIYQIAGPYSREKERVLLSLDMSKPQNQRPASEIVRTDNDFPISWIRVTADGTRVFYCSLGHRPDIYYVPEILKHYLDGIQFALGDLPADAVPSAKLKIRPKPALAPDQPVPLQDRAKD